MHLSIIFAATLVTFSTAQSTATTTSTAISSPASVQQTPAQVSQAACLLACPVTDPNCRQTCVSNAQINTIDCIAKCPKGSGTAAENLFFETCQRTCISGSSPGAPASTIAVPTGLATVSGQTVPVGSGSATKVLGAMGTGAVASASVTVGGNTAMGTAKLTDASVTPKGNAGGRVRVGGVGVVIGLGVVFWL